MKIAQVHVDNTLGELWDVEVMSGYTGRGMGSKECLAVVTDMTGWGLAKDVSGLKDHTVWAEEGDLVEYLLAHEPRTDSMGLSTIYYWPSVQVTED